jgi:hypothetical protein
MAADTSLNSIEAVLKKKLSNANATALATQLHRGAENALELEDTTFDEWLKERFQYQLVWLDQGDYARALIRALWLAPKFAATDFGSARQRDFGQVWTDTARGFMGEIALKKFFAERLDTSIEFDTGRGKVEEFLPSDIKSIQRPGEKARKGMLRVSIKTSKFNGRWLDVPGAQVEHSDIFIFIKIGIARPHLLAFMKAISFLKDKLFAEGRRLGELDEKDSKELWDEVPDFEEIPVYVAGFLDKSTLTMPIDQVGIKVSGRKNKKLLVYSGVGIFSTQSVRERADVKYLDPAGTLPIVIDPMIDLGTSPHFMANSGALEFGKRAWQKLLERL